MQQPAGVSFAQKRHCSFKNSCLQDYFLAMTSNFLEYTGCLAASQIHEIVRHINPHMFLLHFGFCMDQIRYNVFISLT